MSITIEMSVQEIAALKQLTGSNGDAEAVIKAAREFVRLARLRELKSSSGKVEYHSNWQELEDVELRDSPLPQ